jgi:hypothetical protein
LWSTGETSTGITVYTSGTYTVTVSDASGCTKATTANVTYNPSDYISTYTILSPGNVTLSSNSKVQSGGVGVTGYGIVNVMYNSYVTSAGTFVKSPSITLTSGYVSTPIYAVANISYPQFLYANGGDKCSGFDSGG